MPIFAAMRVAIGRAALDRADGAAAGEGEFDQARVINAVSLMVRRSARFACAALKAEVAPLSHEARPRGGDRESGAVAAGLRLRLADGCRKPVFGLCYTQHQLDQPRLALAKLNADAIATVPGNARRYGVDIGKREKEILADGGDGGNAAHA
jgi:hypothetical protein